MDHAAPVRRTRPILLGLGALAVAFVAAYALAPAGDRDRAAVADAALLVVNVLSGLAILRSVRGPDGWRAGTPLGLSVLVAAVPHAVNLVRMASGGAPLEGAAGPADLIFLVMGFLAALPFLTELRDHFTDEDRLEIGADVGLIAAAAGSVVYLLIRPEPSEAASTMALASSVVFAAVAVTLVAAWGALALWIPSPTHLGLFALLGMSAGGVIPFAFEWVRGTYTSGQAAIELPFGLAAIGLAALFTVEPRLTQTGPAVSTSRWGRPILTAASVAGAAVALGFPLVLHEQFDVRAGESVVLLAILAIGIVARILMNQVRSTRAREETQRALSQTDQALRETDDALARVRRAHDTLAESEERLRLLFDAAVDGIVELDGQNVIRRANEAFVTMAGLQADRIVGRTWTEVAGAVEGTDPAFASLPEVGQATLARDGHGLHLEARSSDLPGPGGGRLLLIRDVTAAKVADQTIRSLFKFLQDRDDDRTRLLRRTNAAIEQERNRIARDLHDGPVQGVSAASLSLEAVLLMLKTGSVESGIDILTKIRQELSEECDNLRRLMADLRPPVLEERGLVPALREMLSRFGRETSVETAFKSRSLVEVPADLETLAYRVVQEALSNAGKHAKARTIEVTVEAVAGQLRIEVEDDGVGFESNKTRDFLRMGRVGLASMRERTELANGTFMVRSTPGSGTTVVATLPLEPIPTRTEPALA